MPKTFEFQSSLPRLPVPHLEHTLKVYLESCLPFYSSSAEHHNYEKIVYDFFQTDGLASILQKRLIAHDKTQLDGSWLEKWWYKYAYLSWRNSVLVHSNWFVLVGPYKNMKSIVKYTEGFSDIQFERAAGFASSFLDYKQLLDDEEIQPEITKQGPLDMHQYSRMFGVTRVPKLECDIIVGDHPCKSKHIIVMMKDQIFVVYVYDKSGGRIAVKEIEKQLRKCVDLVESAKSLQPPIGLLSGQHRDRWAEHHGYLLRNSNNQASFEMIESAIFAIALDHKIIPQGVSYLAKNVFHGFDGHNRWFDKSLSIVVDNCGRLGVNGEHSPCDALVPAILVDFAAKR
jgi:carnitine O-acetyltransferase